MSAIKTQVLEALERFSKTPRCPKGFFEHETSIEGISLVCFLEHDPAEIGSVDSMGMKYEPDIPERMMLQHAYIDGTDTDIAQIILQYLVDQIEEEALRRMWEGG